MFGEKRTLDSAWLERAQDDIAARNKSAYQKALNQAKSDYANADWLTKLTSGITEKNYLNRHGFNDNLQQAASTGQLSSSDLHDYLGGVERNLTADMERGTGAVSALNNIPVVGGILNYLTAPVAQLAGAGRALQAGVQGDWNRWNQRDHVSDAAALGKVGLEALTAGIGTPAALGSKVGFGMATGAADNALDTIREQGSQMNAGDVLKSAGIGAAFGGAFPVVGNALSNVATRGAENAVNKALASSGFGVGVDPRQFTKAAINSLGEGQYRELLNAAQQGVGNKLANFATGSRLAGASTLNGLRSMPLSRKALLAGGIGGGAIGLSNLLRSRNQQQLSDEDLAALYNYYGAGE